MVPLLWLLVGYALCVKGVGRDWSRQIGLGELDPDLLEAPYNIRECCKQLLLLEDHLFNPRKRCPDCIHKHRLTAEALADEARTLRGAERYPVLRRLSVDVRGCKSAQDVRRVRKGLTAMLRAEGLGEVKPRLPRRLTWR